MRIILVVCIFLAFFLSNLYSQESIPDGFTTIVLGDSIDSVKANLLRHSDFRYRGDPDVSLMPRDQQPLIKTQGRGFILSGVFQFKDDYLYSIILNIDEQKLDYFTMYSLFSEKYGEPIFLTPQYAHWETETRRMVLEKPVVVKYLDVQVLDQIRDESLVKESFTDYSRELFLSHF